MSFWKYCHYDNDLNGLNVFCGFFVCDLLNLSSSYSEVCDFVYRHDPWPQTVSKWLSIKPKQLCHGENKLIFNEMMMMSALY
jgi:hypothetical protein